MRKFSSMLALIAFFYVINIQNVSAIRAYPNPVTVTQPDGSSLTIRLQGDEFYHYQTTEDGYLLKQNSQGYLTYAVVTATGAVIESENIARNINQRSASDIKLLSSINKDAFNQTLQSTRQKSKMLTISNSKPRKAYPINGSPKALVILANFKDKKFVVTNPITAFQNLLTQSGYSANGGTGSAKDFFMANSLGKFSPNFITTDTVTLPQNYSYYGADSGGEGNDTNPLQMIIDACTAADNKGLDFAQYDTDNDGVIDNVFVYFAGYNQAENAPSNTIWPHRWGIYPKSIYPSDYNYSGTIASITFDGKRLMDYACSSELKGTSGVNMCGIGTFVHEFGHVIGLPDYYHTDSPDKNTLNYWSTMDMGPYLNEGRTPPAYSAYDRFFLGWFTPEQVSTPSDLTLLPLYQGTTQPANTNQQSYLFSATTHDLNGANPNPKEFFMVEYRKQTGWDKYLPGEGMLIWHIDYNQTAWDNNSPNNYSGTSQTASSHMRVYLQPLSGSTTTPGAAFTSGSFTPTTWSGTNINRAITSINKTEANVTFKLMGGTPVDPNAPAVKIGVIQSSLQFASTKVSASKVKTFNIKTTDLSGNLTLAVTGTNAAYFIVSSTSITKEAANATTGTNITITYSPSSTGEHTAKLTISGGGLNPSKEIDLSGTGI